MTTTRSRTCIRARYARLAALANIALLQKIIRPDHAAPHVCDRTAIEAQALFRLPKVTADNIGEIVHIDDHALFEGVQVIQGY